jgi:hypothetical protein
MPLQLYVVVVQPEPESQPSMIQKLLLLQVLGESWQPTPTVQEEVKHLSLGALQVLGDWSQLPVPELQEAVEHSSKNNYNGKIK